MKIRILLALGLLTLVTSCRNSCKDEVVKETFLHKYGVPISKDDWVRNGREGSIVDLRKDGVTVTRSYSKGVLDGKTTYTFPHSSTVQVTDTFVNGQLASKTENYLSGVPMVEEKYADGYISQVLRWYEDGTPAASEFYDSGYLVKGEYKTPLNVVESQVIDGEGVRILRGGDGQLIAKETIKNKETIERINFFQNGEPSSITPYEHGVIHGNRFSFLQGGLPHTLEEWRFGHQEGTTIVYVNGEKMSEIPYVKGEKHGIEKKYRDGQVVVEEVTWRRGIQHGPRMLIAEDGSTLTTEWYHEGALVSRPTYERMNVR